MTPVLVAGLGSSHGDDRAGWLVVERLRELGAGPDQARQAAHPADLLDWCNAATRLIVCDACQGPAPAGALRRWCWPADSLAEFGTLSTHGMPLADALALGRSLGRWPASVEIWGVVGERFEPGSPAAEAVSASARQLAEQLWAELAQ